MNNFIIWAVITIICFLLYKLFDFLSIRWERNRHEIASITSFILSILFIIFFAISFMSEIIVLVITALSPLR